MYLNGLRKITKCLGHGTHCPGQDPTKNSPNTNVEFHHHQTNLLGHAHMARTIVYKRDTTGKANNRQKSAGKAMAQLLAVQKLSRFFHPSCIRGKCNFHSCYTIYVLCHYSYQEMAIESLPPFQINVL